DGNIRVARVLAERLAVCGEIVSQRLTIDVDQRTNDAAGAWMDGGEAAAARAAQQPQQERLGLVVLGVRDGDCVRAAAVGGALEKGVPRPPGGAFDRPPVRAGEGR